MNIHFEYSFWVGENAQKTESKSEILWENSAFLKSEIKYLFIFLEKVLTSGMDRDKVSTVNGRKTLPPFSDHTQRFPPGERKSRWKRKF